MEWGHIQEPIWGQRGNLGAVKLVWFIWSLNRSTNFKEVKLNSEGFWIPRKNNKNIYHSNCFNCFFLLFYLLITFQYYLVSDNKHYQHYYSYLTGFARALKMLEFGFLKKIFLNGIGFEKSLKWPIFVAKLYIWKRCVFIYHFL